MNPDPKTESGFDAAWLEIPDPARGATADLGAAVSVPREPALTRGEVRRRRQLALAVAIGWPLAVLALWGLRASARDLVPFLTAQVMVWSALLVVCASTAVSRGARGLGRPIQTTALAVIGVPAVFVALGLFWLAPGASEAFGELGTFAQWRGCVGLGALVMLPTLAFSAWALRRAFPSGAAWRGAAVGASSGLGAALVLTLHCGVTQGGHVALAHGGAMVLAVSAGALAGVRFGRA